MSSILESNNNFLKSQSVLCISNDSLIKDRVAEARPYIKNIMYKETTLDITENYFDLIIIDLNKTYIDLIFIFIKEKFPFTPIIFFVEEVNISLLKYNEMLSLKNILIKKHQSLDILVYILIELLKGRYLNLSYGYKYCLNTYRLYHESEEQYLTKTERGLLKLLILNRQEIVPYDTIKNEVWKNKKFSVFTMRNKVKSIRDKTYPEIIKNYSGFGYKLDDNKE